MTPDNGQSKGRRSGTAKRGLPVRKVSAKSKTTPVASVKRATGKARPPKSTVNKSPGTISKVVSKVVRKPIRKAKASAPKPKAKPALRVKTKIRTEATSEVRATPKRPVTRQTRKVPPQPPAALKPRIKVKTTGAALAKRAARNALKLMAKVEHHEAKAAATNKPLKVPLPPVLLEAYAPPGSNETGPGERYALGATPPQDRFGNEAGELPESYGTNMIFLTAREPGCLLASWDVAPVQQRRFNAISRDRHLILRLFEGGQIAHPVGEVHVHPESKQWLVHVDTEASSHSVELGLYTRDGEWIPVSKSAPLIVAQAATIPEDTFVSLPPEVPVSKLLEKIAEPSSQSAAIPPGTSNPPIEAAIPRESLKSALRAKRPSAPTRPTTDLPVLLAIHQLKQANPESVPTVTFTHHMPAQAESTLILGRETERAIQWQRVAGSMEVSGLDHLKGNVPGALERIGLTLPESTALANPPTSPVMPPPSDQRGFCLQVNAELIIYGATDSAAKVKIAGQPITLGPDGQFSFRFSFPDGTHHLPVEAQSADGAEIRGVHLSFLRASDHTGNVATHPQDSALKPPGVINEQG